MSSIVKTDNSEGARHIANDIAKFITDDMEESVADILKYLDEAAQRKKGEAPVLVLRPEVFSAS